MVVDDEVQIGDVLRSDLVRDGFDVSMQTNVRDALARLESDAPDLMILDITLPDGSGFDILKEGRVRNVPAIMLTARGDEVDRIVGLELGADDYISKPFSPREVIARVRAVLRRSEDPAPGPSSQPGHLHVDDLDIDQAAHEVRVAGKPANLTPSEFRILATLAQSPGRVFTRAQLLDRIGDDGSIFERTLDRHVNNLRKKIERDPAAPSRILTVYGIGYKLSRDDG